MTFPQNRNKYRIHFSTTLISSKFQSYNKYYFLIFKCNIEFLDTFQLFGKENKNLFIVFTGMNSFRTNNTQQKNLSTLSFQDFPGPYRLFRDKSKL
ncbi:hypothetical protein LEP1GSC041_2025 [Leptospira noguchii str. 2006001870]|nr:hypothetical protein LEP1GSC041_2025 [Leptospira noguchii str. 2006001870]